MVSNHWTAKRNKEETLLNVEDMTIATVQHVKDKRKIISR